MRPLFATIYVVVLLVWTWLLVKPEPIPESLVGGVAWFDPRLLHFLLAKSLHFGVYSGFAFLGAWLVRDRYDRKWIWIALVLHGVASEVGQMVGSEYFDTKRHGCLRDMVIDATGVTFGALLVNRWRKSPPVAESGS